MKDQSTEVCVQAYENSSISIVNKYKGSRETYIRFNINGQDSLGLHNIEDVLLSIEKASPAFVVLPDSVSRDAHEVILKYNREFEFYPFGEIESFIDNPREVVFLGLDAALALHELHSNNLIHGQFTPELVVKRKGGGGYKLLYLAGLPFSNYKLNLTSLAPEKLNREAGFNDTRSDLYSLGVLLYQASTGCLPCADEDTIKTVHRHLAFIPESPSVVNTKIPESLSRIINKLLKKNPEERYQTAYGVARDLALIEEGLNNNIVDMNFKIASSDKAPRLNYSNKLYGREVESRQLRQELEEACKKDKKMITVSGVAGVGKTSLVTGLVPYIQKRGGVYISGKCSQLEQKNPYEVVSDTVQTLIHQLLKKPKEQIERMVKRISPSFLKSARVLTGIIPDLELLTGPLPEVEDFGLINSKNRLYNSFNEFMRVLGMDEELLVIFFDDLQWIDKSSLELIENTILNSNENNNMIFILAYRRNEIIENSDIENFLNLISLKSNLTIELKPLGINPLEQFLSDSLIRSNEDIRSFSNQIIAKTGGNPFYVKTFLEKLQNENTLVFDYERQLWTWNISDIIMAPGTDNVLDLLAAELKKMNRKYLRILSYAACFGLQFDLKLLSFIMELPAPDIKLALDEITGRGYIFKCHVDKDEYCFIHDKIQQAVYCLINDPDKSALHLNIGRRLNSWLEDNLTNILIITSHYNRGRPLIVSKNEKIELIHLNVKAGKIARENSAWEEYYSFSLAGIDLVPGIELPGDAQILFQLFRQGVESARLTRRFKTMESWIDLSESFDFSIENKVLIESERITALMARNKMSEAISEAEKLLGVLNEEVSGKYKIFRRRFLRHSDIFFDSLAETENLSTIVAFEIQMLSFSAVYLSAPERLPYLVNQMLGLTTTRGRSKYHAFFLVMFGLTLLNKVKTFKFSIRFGRLAMILSRKDKNSFLRPKILFIFGGFIQHWFEPLKHCLGTLEEAIEIGREIGDFEYSVLSQNLILFLNFVNGKNLLRMEGEKDQQLERVNKLGFKRSQLALLRTYSLIGNLTGRSYDKFTLSNGDSEEFEILDRCLKTKDFSGTASFYVYKIMINFYYGDFKTALEFSEKAEEYASGLLGQVTYILLLWFTALSRLELLHEAGSKKNLKEIKRVLGQLKTFTRYCPENHEHRVLFLEAGLAKYYKDDFTAVLKYEQASEQARINGFIQDEALICEYTGKYYMEHEKEFQGKFYLHHAGECYERWGAIRKLDHLKGIYPFLKDINLEGKQKENIVQEVTRIVDLSSLMSASQAISGPIVLKELMGTILEVIIENSGAQRGLLFLVDSDNLFTLKAAASFDADSKNIIIDSSPDSDGWHYSETVLEYTMRKKEVLLLSDGLTSVEYASLPYFQEEGIRSLLCVPLLHLGTMIGCIYLENNLAPGVFSSEHLDVIKMLSGQIAISLENSQLYENLYQSYSALEKKEEKNREQFRQLIEAEKLASLGILAASVTHEISNPNYAIQLNSEFLVDSRKEIISLLDEYSSELQGVRINGLTFCEFKKKFPQVINTIMSCSRQIDSVVKELKNYARREPEEPMVRLDVNRIIESTVMLCAGLIEKATCNFTMSLEKSLPEVRGYSQKIQQVIMNLIINGCQSLPDENHSLAIESSCNPEEGIICIKVIDQGTGIDLPCMENIRTPFYSTKGGMGLGLSISDEIIKQHAGTLDFLSNDVAGTTVIISLPAIKEDSF
ncbi:MAG: AAA family ATPase [Spirochaetales bacterium]|nr:AAA family ATPase [Spirochaetales bacterium]